MFVRARAKSLARESGQVVVLFALLLPVLFGLGAIVLDIGNWYVHKRHLQTQVDAAALAAAPSFSGCFFDPTAANLAIASTALSYAGDTARDPSSANQQVQDAGQRPGDAQQPALLGRGRSRHADADRVRDDGSDGRRQQCRHPVRDEHARCQGDGRRRPEALLLARDPPGHQGAREGGDPRGEGGVGLPPARRTRDRSELRVRDLRRLRDRTGRRRRSRSSSSKKDPTTAYRRVRTFPYSAWVTKTDVPGRPGPQNAASLSTRITHTATARASSSSCRSPTPPRRRSGTLNQICNQTPTDLVQCYAGTGSAGYDGAATGQGLAFIHSFATSNGTPAAPLLRDVQLTGMVCTGGAAAGEPLGPVLRERRQRLHGRRHREGRLRRAGTPANGDRGRSRTRAASARKSDRLDCQHGEHGGTSRRGPERCRFLWPAARRC